MPTRLQLARADILQYFKRHARKTFKQRELESILADKREEWRLAQSMSFADFLKYLVGNCKLRRIEFPFPHRTEVRYAWGDVPLEAIVLTLKGKCHYSHYTAVHLHDLTEQDPQIIYVNHEQPPKPPPATGLSQEGMDRAFRRRPRTTRNIAKIRSSKYGGARICLLNGKHTGQLGIEERLVNSRNSDAEVSVRLTDVERTLIDITVRPFYSGGVAEVMKAYRRAADRVSLNRMAGMLRKLAFVYPYHQAIGFYVDACGAYPSSAVDFFRRGFDLEFDFYLTYAMQDLEYNRRWRIYVPKGFTPIF